MIEIQGRKIVLKAGQWSRWTKLDFTLFAAWFLPGQGAIGNLPVLPPGGRAQLPALRLSDQHGPARPCPDDFRAGVVRQGCLAAARAVCDHRLPGRLQARKNGVFVDDEYARQAGMVLDERLALLDYALENYEDGLLFFYFSSSDLQSHMFWWDSDDPHPIRTDAEAKKYFGHVHRLYRKLDEVIGDLMDRYGRQATLIVMSDHGFANFGQQFNVNTWLRSWGYLGPPECTSIMTDVDWSQTVAYGLGINGLYLNMKGRERDGIVEPGDQREALLTEIDRAASGRHRRERAAGDPRRLSLGQDLPGQRDGACA